MFLLATATATIVLPLAPQPLLPDFWTLMKGASTEYRPDSFHEPGG
jgi:hypothetical protein